MRLMDWMGDISIDKVEPNQLEKFMVYLKNDFRITKVATTPIKPKKLSVKSLSNAHCALTVFWKWVSKEYGIKNPFLVSPIKSYTKPIQPLKGEEIEKLLLACRQSRKEPKNQQAYNSKRSTYKRDKAILLILLDTGIRVSELCDISIDDVNLESGRIFVTGKGNKSRFVFLGKISRQAIWSYVAERFPNHEPPKDEPLFVERYGMYRLTRQGVLQLVRRLGTKAGIKGVHPHRFRHTFAVEFLRNGGNVFELQQLLGHSDLEMSRRYVKLAQVDLETSARRASPADKWRLK